MKLKKRYLAAGLIAAMTLGLVGCGSSESPSTAKSDDGAKVYNVGICQFAQHPALDAATEGFVDVLQEKLGEQVKIENQNASGDITTCGVICSGFAASQVDLILANATPALQAASSATTEIPILGTAVTEYGVALDLENFDGTVGGNIAGTSDLAPLDQQAAMIPELLPEAKTVGILYCSAEANSVYQAEVVQKCLEEAGLKVQVFTFADSNDVSAVTGTACGECDALYIPTDNTAATCAEAINNVAAPAGIPIISGDADTCRSCGVASFCIDYYELGRTTGEMAVKLLQGEADVATMPIEYAGAPTKMYNKEIVESLGIEIPGDYSPLD